jgi:hypothetical protein
MNNWAMAKVRPKVTVLGTLIFILPYWYSFKLVQSTGTQHFEETKIFYRKCSHQQLERIFPHWGRRMSKI